MNEYGRAWFAYGGIVDSRRPHMPPPDKVDRRGEGGRGQPENERNRRILSYGVPWEPLGALLFVAGFLRSSAGASIPRTTWRCFCS